MSYRVATYFKPASVAPEKAIRFSSEGLATAEEASALLDSLVVPEATPFIGGHIEQHVPNIGWVILDEVETVIYLNRLAVSDGEMNADDSLAELEGMMIASAGADAEAKGGDIDKIRPADRIVDSELIRKSKDKECPDGCDHKYNPDCALSCYDEGEYRDERPEPGTAAYTAWVMAQLWPDEEDGFWDDWKEATKGID